MDYEREKEYLEKILKIIHTQIDELGDKFDEAYKKLCNDNKMHWEELPSNIFDRSISESNLKSQVEVLDRKLVEGRRLIAAKDSPYFGLIGVSFDEDDKEDYRIGYTTIYDKYGDPVILDWRTKIAELFVNSKLGKTSYQSPTGETIECNLDTRKQIKIKNAKLERIVDTDVHIDDDVLQEVLSKSSDSKMRNIVSTIQEEQNEVIRNIKDKTIIVEGKAGSGKTSIGLHRLAYLLYYDRKSTSNNMLIFSPSDVFSSYISSVLPELGEENVLETTFKDFSESFINGFSKLESYTEFVAKYYNNENTEEKNKLNEFKFSKEFKKILDDFVIKKSSTYHFRDDFSMNGLTIVKDYLNNLLDSESFKGYPFYERVDMLADVIIKNIKEKNLFTKEKLVNKLKSELVTSYSHRKNYNEFLESDEFKEASGMTDKIQNNKYLEYPDIIGMLYLYFEMFGYPENNIIHHVVIDEAQDYTPLQLTMIKKMCDGATFTVLGDSDQTINPYYKYNSLEEMKEVLGISKYMELNKAYRSSPEIMEYASKITDKPIVSVRRSENVPVDIKEVDKKDLFTTLVKDVLNLKENGYERICIITKNNNDAKAIYEGLKDEIDNITILSDDKKGLEYKTSISPVYISKGLEFDAVINYNNKEDEYEDKDKYLYYVASTRAQHSLTIYNEPEKILKKGVK